MDSALNGIPALGCEGQPGEAGGGGEGALVAHLVSDGGIASDVQ